MGVHARLSASKTKEWAACPGLIALHERFPVNDPSGEAAQMGTVVHGMIEKCLKEGTEPSEYQDRIIVLVHPDTAKEGISVLKPNAKTPKVGTIWFEFDQELVDAATCMTNYVRRRMDVILPEKMTSDKAVDQGLLQLEKRTNPLPHRDDTGGTADVTLYDLDEDFGGEIEIADYKNGTGVYVPVEGNKQLLSYLLGQVMDLLGSISDDYIYRMTICQPRHHLTPDDGIMSVLVTAHELRAFEAELEEACLRVDQGRKIVENLFRARNQTTLEECIDVLDAAGLLEVSALGGDTIWDPYLKMAPSVRRMTEDAAQVDFDDDPPEDAKAPETPAHIAKLLNWAPTLEKMIKDAKAKANEILNQGGEVPGYKLVRKQGNRQWVDTVMNGDGEKIAAKIAKDYGVDEEKLLTDPVPPALRTGPQVLARIPKADKERFEKEYIQRPQGDLTMVPDSDKRKAINPMDNAADDFDDDPLED